MAAKKEFKIQLEEQRVYFPSDIIKGQVILDLKKPVDVLHISVNFQGIIEGCGDKNTIINETELLAKPKGDQKYTTFTTGQLHAFSFQFSVPKQLPSSFDCIPKIAKVSYFLTASHKKPKFKLSHSLSTIIEDVQILDRIDIALPEYALPIKMMNDLGFVNSSKLTNWSLSILKSAYSPGDKIRIECNFNNFPLMDKPKAVQLSLIRQIHKTSTAKIADSKILSTKTIDLNIVSESSILTQLVNLKIPHNTPPNVFPNNGRILSISYMIQAELNMKNVKTPIELKPTYSQEIAIVVGTIGGESTIAPKTTTQTFENFSRVSLQTTSPKTSCEPGIKEEFNQSATSLPSTRFSPISSPELKPLARLSENQLLKSPRSYLLSNNSSFSSSASAYTTSSTPISLASSAYQQAFDDYIPEALTRKESLSPTDPLPSVKEQNELMDSYVAKKPSQKRQSSLLVSLSDLPPKLPPRKNMVTILSVPHEIGPDDIITRETTDEKLEVCSLPSLLHRNDTLSTSSSAGLMEDLFPDGRTLVSDPLQVTNTIILN
ncbi:uncharacterized protein B0P05DRAFT_588008 [Gilbertella persicaria]|uniref:uncharacterized protein n=1 Tax=Gilbertella persicaria TaxID=101096 RepID=UPI00221F3CD4|nr:uncharacterized protein B0P05DRAFT_588008 [Gilbertella persicaria]KAI8076705.1 hypothetical protein B0P05DRAFT_588008 [Gilbertella persicaria]